MTKSFAVLAVLLGLGGAFAVSASPVVIKNEDNEHIFMESDTVGDNMIGFGEKALVEYVDFLTKGKALTHVFYCACGQRASFDSEAWEPIWYGMDEKDFMGRTNYSWKVRAKAYRDSGIDPYKVMVRRTRDNQVSPWMSMRMNDIHFVTSDKLSRTTRFWRDHPEFRVYPEEKAFGSKRPWYDFTLDFRHQEVRDYNFRMAHELLNRYDVDGLELDWMRCMPCLRLERAREDAHFLTDFVRRVKKAANRAAEYRDHPVGVAVRVPPTEADCLELGIDIRTWLTEKLVDIVVLSGESSAYFEIDLAKWSREAKALNPSVIIVPAIDRIHCAFPCFPQHVDMAGYRGWADAMLSRGGDGLYLFNLEYSPKAAQRDIYAGGLQPEKIGNLYRRYFVTIDDVREKMLRHCRSLLPVPLNAPGEIPIVCGSTRPTKSVEVVLGFNKAETQAAKLALTLNGVPAEAVEEVAETSQYCGVKRWTWMRSLKVFRWKFPLSAFKQGENKLAFAPLEGDDTGICWAEIALDR